MRWLLGGLIFVALTSCYPLYIPPHANMTELEQAGDVHAQAGVGFHGWNLAGAYAVTDHVSVRAEGNTDLDTNSSRGRAYGQLGVGAFWSNDVEPATERHPIPSGVRTGVAVDVGVGRSAGSASTSIGNTRTTFLWSATFIRGAVEGEFSFESEYVGAGLVARFAALKSTPAAGNQDATEAFWTFAEPLLVLRVGTRHFKVDLQAGISLPVGGQGNIGGWMPFIMQLGFSGDWSLGPERRPEPPPPPPSEPEVVPPAPVLPPEGPPPTPPNEPGAPAVDVPPAGDEPPPPPAPPPPQL